VSVLLIISIIASTVVSVAACLTVVIKPFREWAFGIKQRNKDVESQNEGVKCLLRSEITRIYYVHLESRELREFQFENLEKLYLAYKALNGNSFIDKIYKEMKDEWTIKKTS